MERLTENREQRSNVLLKLLRSAREVDGLNGTTPETILDSSNEQGRRDLLRNLGTEQYLGILAGINGILRGKKKTDWDMDGVGVTMAGGEVRGKHLFPRHQDKKEILDASWHAAQQMNAGGRSLEDIGMLLGSLLVETHPFGDGNGRTSRLIYTLIKDGYNPQDTRKLQAVLGEEGRNEFDMALPKGTYEDAFEKKYGRTNEILNPNHIHGLQREGKPFGELRFPTETPEAIQSDIIEAARNDEKILLCAALQIIQVHPELPLASCVKEFSAGNFLLLQRLLSLPTAENIDELHGLYWQTKKIFTLGLIDIFLNPEKPEYQIETPTGTTSLLQIFKDRIASHTLYVG